MVYNDGTDDEPLDFRVIMPNGRVVYSNPENIIFVGERKKSVERAVEKPKEDDLSKYYDYDCENSDGVEEEEPVKYWNWEKKVDGLAVMVVIAAVLFVLEVILTWK